MTARNFTLSSVAAVVGLLVTSLLAYAEQAILSPSPSGALPAWTGHFLLFHAVLAVPSVLGGMVAGLMLRLKPVTGSAITVSAALFAALLVMLTHGWRGLSAPGILSQATTVCIATAVLAAVAALRGYDAGPRLSPPG